jgi:hypothetical protein
MLYRGSCHRSAVQFEVETDNNIKCGDYNCSIYSKSGFLHLIVSKSKFKLLHGKPLITTY